MACNHCGGASSIRVERASSGSKSSTIAKQQEKIPLRPLKRATVRVIRPANHLDKRM
jgi:hypothetical protein